MVCRPRRNVYSYNECFTAKPRGSGKGLDTAPREAARARYLAAKGRMRSGNAEQMDAYQPGSPRVSPVSMPSDPIPSRSWFGFLRIEADLAMTLIDVARSSLRPEHAALSLGNARKALAEIQRSLMKPAARGLSEDEVLFLEQRCMEIESALALAEG